MAPLPLHTAGPYVAGAYIAFFLIVLIYVAIMATKLTRNERTLSDLTEELRRRSAADGGEENGHR
ncbi:MAG: hypothetical protein ABSC56_06100 [Solirubrobacteraceae bacterium]